MPRTNDKVSGSGNSVHAELVGEGPGHELREETSLKKPPVKNTSHGGAAPKAKDRPPR